MVAQNADDPKESGGKANSDKSANPSIEENNKIKTQPPTSQAGNQPSSLEEQMSRSERGMLRSTRVTAAFTGMLTILAAIQAYSFIESERAFLIMDNIELRHGEPTADPDGYALVMTIRNVGKHTAVVSEFNVEPAFFIREKNLPDAPPYGNQHSVKVVIPPIVPDKSLTVSAEAVVPVNNPISDADRLTGVLSGKIPLRVFGFIAYDRGFFLVQARKGRFLLALRP